MTIVILSLATDGRASPIVSISTAPDKRRLIRVFPPFLALVVADLRSALARSCRFPSSRRQPARVPAARAAVRGGGVSDRSSGLLRPLKDGLERLRRLLELG